MITMNGNWWTSAELQELPTTIFMGGLWLWLAHHSLMDLGL